MSVHFVATPRKRQAWGIKEGMAFVYQPEKAIYETVYYLLFCSYFDGAEKLLKKGLSLFPNSANLYALLGILYAETSREQEAIVVFQKVLKIDPNNPDALFYLGIYEQSNAKIELALQGFKALIESEKDPEELARLLCKKAYVLFVIGELAQAFCALMEAYKQNSQQPELFVNLGTLSLVLAGMIDGMDMHKVDEQYIEMFNHLLSFARKELKLDVGLEKAERETSSQLLALKFKQAAEAAYKKSMAINRRYSMAFICLGTMYYSQENYAQAEENFKQAVALNPKNSTAQFYLGMSLLNQAKIGQAGAAKAALNEAFRLGYGNGEHLFKLAELFLITKDYVAAKIWFKRALALYEKNGVGLNFVVEYKMLLKKLEQAAEDHPDRQDVLDQAEQILNELFEGEVQ